MAKEKLGPWHSAECQPVHVGVYEVDLEDDDGRAFAYWDGRLWFFPKWEIYGDGTKQDAINRAKQDRNPFKYTYVRWRGLLRDA